MNQPYPPGGGQPYPAGGGPPYSPGGQPSYPAGGQPSYPPPGSQQYPGGSPYPGGQQYPGGGQQYPGGPSPYYPGQPAFSQGPPRSIRTAVILMYVGAGLEALGLLFNLLSVGHSGSDGASGIGSSLIGIGLWVWMARTNQAGKRWARVTSTVFFGIDSLVVLLLLIGVSVVMHSASSSVKALLVLALVAGIAEWTLGLATIILLWRRESSDYYDAMSPR